MNETREEYAVLMEGKVALLEKSLGRRVVHGGSARCPRCGEKGYFDVVGLGFALIDNNAIYYSTVFEEWRCRLCDFRMCA